MSAAICPIHEPTANVTTLLDEKLTATEWTKVLGVSAQIFRRRVTGVATTQLRESRLVQCFAASSLPEDYRDKAVAAKEQWQARSYGELLAMITCETRRKPEGKSWEAAQPPARERALKRMAIMQEYFAGVAANKAETECVRIGIAAWLRIFGEVCNEKTIRRLRDKLAEFGGELAAREAYLDNKSCAHKAARREVKLGIPEDLIAEFKDRATKCEHISSAFESIVADWECGREVPGLGFNEEGTRFAWTYEQFRPFAPSNPARRLGSHGKARARRECLAVTFTSTANLRPNELWVLDDTRLDVVATNDLTGRPVELKSYWLMDVATRRILAFQIVEDGNLTAEYVFAMLSRALRAAGLPASYPLHIKFERGTVACAPAAESLLRSMWPGRVQVHRTSMDGGRNHGSDWIQSPSGHWMGKAHIESFMRTLAFRLESLPGQRGGDYRRQPAQLGLTGRNREAGLLKYDAGSQIHEAAKGEVADKLLRWMETGDLAAERRLQVSALRPVSWIVAAVRETVARYNARDDHRMEGFDRIEWQDAETGKLCWRMESPDEKWARLAQLWRLEPIAQADAVSLLKLRARLVTVGKHGVFVTVDGMRFQFTSPASRVMHEVSLLTTQQRRYVALLDEDSIRHFDPAQPTPVELHLLDAEAPGKEGRYLETLPLVAWPDQLETEQLAKAASKAKQIEARAQAELLQARRPTFERKLAEAEQNTDRMRGAITLLRQETTEPVEESAVLTATRNAGTQAAEARAATTREQQAADGTDRLRELLHGATLIRDEED